MPKALQQKTPEQWLEQTAPEETRYLSAIHKFLRNSPAIDVHIVPQEVK